MKTFKTLLAGLAALGLTAGSAYAHDTDSSGTADTTQMDTTSKDSVVETNKDNIHDSMQRDKDRLNRAGEKADDAADRAGDRMQAGAENMRENARDSMARDAGRGARPATDFDATKVTVAAGAGLSDFTGGLGDRTNIGLGWNVRGGYDFTRHIGLEVGYLGARNQIDDTRIARSSITTTGLNGDLKLKADLNRVQPYVFGGLGAAYYNVTGSNSIYQDDTAIQVPVGVGADAFLSKDISLGARFNYLANLASRVSDETTGNQYNLTANLGIHY